MPPQFPTDCVPELGQRKMLIFFRFKNLWASKIRSQVPRATFQLQLRAVYLAHSQMKSWESNIHQGHGHAVAIDRLHRPDMTTSHLAPFTEANPTEGLTANP